MQQLNILSWAAYKDLILRKNLSIQYTDSGDTYVLYAPESNSLLWHYSLPKDGNEDVLDFETNFKSTANKPLELKASTGAAHRIASTSQPLDTTEKWKGYHVEMAIDETEKIILINFASDVYLRGGIIYSDDCNCKDNITVDIVWTAYPDMIIYPNLLESIYMNKNVPIPFISNECMKFPSMLSLQITYHKYNDSEPRCISAIANFFEPPQLI